MRISVIHNPTAGDEAISKQKLIGLLRDAGFDPAYYSKKNDWKRFLENPGEMVVIAGGDGTIRSVTARLIGKEIPIAVIPLGTANNIAASLGVEASPDEIIAELPRARPTPFDVGLVEGPPGKTWFLEGAGVGLFTQTMSILDAVDDNTDAEFSTARDKLYRDLSALIVLVSEFTPVELTIHLEGDTITDRFLLVEVMNTNSVGPNLHLAPSADPGDGFLDFLAIRESEREKLTDYLHYCMSGEEPNASIRSSQVKSVTITGREPLHVDGKIWPAERGELDRPIEFELGVQPGALKFLLPPKLR